MVDRRAAALDGAGSMAPMLLGVAPFGLVAGATAIEAGFPPVLAVAASALIFAGAAQLAVIGLVGAGAAPPVVVATAVVVNLRYLMYSAGIAPYFRSFRRSWRVLLGYLLTDQAFALSVTRYESDDPIAGQDGDGWIADQSEDERSEDGLTTDDPVARRWFYLGGAGSLWVVWVGTTAVGVLVGAEIPPQWSLEFAVPLTFLALLVPAIEGRATAAAAAVAGSVAVLGVELPLNAGLMAGALAGLVAGALVDHRWGSGVAGADAPNVDPSPEEPTPTARPDPAYPTDADENDARTDSGGDPRAHAEDDRDPRADDGTDPDGDGGPDGGDRR